MPLLSGAKISLTLAAKKPASKFGPKIKPAGATLHESDDEGDSQAPQHQSVSLFDARAGGAISETASKDDSGQLVIPRQANRDWRATRTRKRQKAALPQAAQKYSEADSREDRQKTVYGLNVVVNGAAGDGEVKADAQPEDGGSTAVAPKTDDELALEALLGNEPKSNLVLPAVEEAAFRADYNAAPEMASLEDYVAVPVEEFGAAMLRGMGWKEGEEPGRRRKDGAVPKAQPRPARERRAALLGIGAKDEAAVGVELGAWGKGGKATRKKVDQVYSPVVLKNSKTGELLTEEELKAKVDQERVDASNEESALKKRDKARRSDDAKDDSRTRHRDHDDRRHRHRHDESSHGRTSHDDRPGTHREGRRRESPRRYSHADEDESGARRRGGPTADGRPIRSRSRGTHMERYSPQRQQRDNHRHSHRSDGRKRDERD